MAVTAGLIVSTIESTDVQPETLSVTVTKYLILEAKIGVMVGLAAEALLRRIVGDQL